MEIVSSKELIKWIDAQIIYGGNEDSLYFLLNIIGGVSKSEINLLKIKPSNEVKINESLDLMAAKWKCFIDTKRPIQYVCKSAYWRDLKLEVTQDVLIPRLETEQIIEIVCSLFPSNDSQFIFADLGTGSGAISIAISLLRPNWKGLASDIDKRALDVAARNLSSISPNSDISFFCGDWWDPLVGFSKKIDLAIVNPPYIPRKVYEDLPYEVKHFEPEIALCGGDDGLDSINKVISKAPEYLRSKGWLIIENHFDQGDKLKNIFFDHGFESIKLINDCYGIGRFTIGRYK
tara:strand:+ start:492 stop:1361 length:870 start_codon:yes stop_codon:yes gene_type:complete